MKTWIALAGATSLIISTNLLAAPEINFNGFLTAGGLFTDTDKATFLNTGKDANFQPDSVVGLQLNMPVNTDASVTVQLTARGNNDFKSDVEWAFLTYSLAENTDLRLGRLRIPFFMISDYLDVGYAYPWVRPPIDVYGQLAFSRYNGINLLSLQQWGDWSASIQGLFGSTSPKQDFFGDTGTLDVRNLWGFNLTLSHEYLTLRLGHTEGNYNLEGISQIDNLLAGLESYGLYGLANRLGVTNKHGQFDGAGVTWDKDNILLMAEYTQRSTDGLISDTDGWYVTGGYRFNRWLIHLTLSALNTREDYSSVEQILNSFDPSGNTTPGTDFVTLMTNDEKSVTLGANFHPKSNLVFKLELQHIKLGNKSSGMLQNFSGNVSNVNVVSFDAAAVF